MNMGEILNELFFSLNFFHRKIICNDKNDSLAQCLAILSIPKKGIQMSIVTKKLGIDKSTLTRIIENLEKLNLVFRKKNNQDRRSVKIYLTKEGFSQSEKYRYRLETLGKQILSNNINNKKELKNSLENFIWELWKYNLKI
tara:strand:+ start:645 stop:1067 length:423 start_codon:yes stop_codon:yes gene_type:complete